MGSAANQILGHALDGLRNVSAGVLANGLTAFIRTLTASGWAAALATIEPASAATVIAVAVVLNFVRERKANITEEQAEKLVSELESLAGTEESALELIRKFASSRVARAIGLDREQLLATVDAVLASRFDELDERLAAIVEDHLDSARKERAEIREVLDEISQTAKLYLDQVDGDLQTVKAGQEALLRGQAALTEQLDTQSTEFMDALRRESTVEYESELPLHATAEVVAQTVATVLDKLQAEGAVRAGATPPHVSIPHEPATITLDPPPLVATRSERRSTVDDVKRALGETNWLAIRGDSGRGKTQLVALVAREHDAATFWIRLRDLDSRQAADRLDAWFRTVRAKQVDSRLEACVSEVCNALPDRTLIVLDDLPYFDAEDPLGLRLLLLVRGLAARNLLLLSTGAHQVPSKLRDALGTSMRAIECAPFTDAEIAELLLAHGAPVTLTQPQRVKFISTVTHAHPVLLVAAARFLQEKQWQFTDAEIEGLLRGQYTRLVAGDTLDRLIATVTDEHSRNLLYRLKLITGEFSAEDVNVVASVNPAIDRASERLHKLTGLWVQRESENRHELSPLVRALPDTNLPVQTRRTVHLALGSRIVRERVLGPWDAARAICHFVGAEQHNYAALLLLQGLRAVLEKGELGEATVLLMMWGSGPIPAEVTPVVQVFLRAHQIEARARFGLSVDVAVSDLDRLMGILPGEETWALLSIVAIAGRTFSQLNPALANRAFLRVIRSWRMWRGPDGQPLLPPEDFEPEPLLWMTVEGLRTREHIRDWLDTVRQLDETSLDRLFSDDLAEDVCLVLADRLWIQEHRRPEGDRDWDAVLSGLDDLAAAAEDLRQPYLKGCVVRAKIVVVAEYKDDLPSAVALGELALAERLEDSRAEFLIRECVACQYVFRQMFREAREWYAEALAVEIDGPKLQRALALVHASRAFGEVNASDGVHYAEEAMRVASAVPDLAVPVRVQLLGELAIARWLAGDLCGAFSALDEAADNLISSPTRDAYWKGLFMCFGHVCGYLASIARTGQPPAAARDGGPWVAPERGFFFRDHERAVDLYAERQSPGIFVHLVLLAEGTGNDGGADKWAAKGLEAARAANLATVAGVFADLSITAQVTRGEYQAATDLGIECGRRAVATKYLMDHGRRPLWEDFDVHAVLQEAGGSFHEQAERHGAISALLPITFHLAKDATVAQVDVSERVGRLTQYLEELATKSPCREYWESLIDVLSQVFIQRKRPSELIQLGNEHDDWLVRILAFLGATLHPDVSLTTAAVNHLAVLSSSSTLLDVVIGAERRIVVPFIDEYWRRAFDRERFRFSAPREVDRDLRTAVGAPAGTRTRCILRTITAGLGVRIPAYARSWLFETPSDDGVPA